mmetsp:Transcript_85325/g.236436  ORF Transcript_85325/g.236436 Transcript_85325/m.236436 type:complete len:327 (-) Transcript_85325:2-982(-)
MHAQLRRLRRLVPAGLSCEPIHLVDAVGPDQGPHGPHLGLLPASPRPGARPKLLPRAPVGAALHHEGRQVLCGAHGHHQEEEVRGEGRLVRKHGRASCHDRARLPRPRHLREARAAAQAPAAHAEGQRLGLCLRSLRQAPVVQEAPHRTVRDERRIALQRRRQAGQCPAREAELEARVGEDGRHGPRRVGQSHGGQLLICLQALPRQLALEPVTDLVRHLADGRPPPKPPLLELPQAAVEARGDALGEALDPTQPRHPARVRVLEAPSRGRILLVALLQEAGLAKDPGQRLAPRGARGHRHHPRHAGERVRGKGRATGQRGRPFEA